MLGSSSVNTILKPFAPSLPPFDHLLAKGLTFSVLLSAPSNLIFPFKNDFCRAFDFSSPSARQWTFARLRLFLSFGSYFSHQKRLLEGTNNGIQTSSVSTTCETKQNNTARTRLNNQYLTRRMFTTIILQQIFVPLRSRCLL